MSSKAVVFNEIEILEFHYIVGDNPAVTAGCPIALGTELVDKRSVEVDFYEQHRCKRKNRKRLTLPVQTRAQILLKRGYTIGDIAEATMAADKINSERLVSASTQKWDRVNEMSERFGRVIRKALGADKGFIITNSAA